MINHISFPSLGLEFTVNRVAFSLFGIDIYWYGIILTTGIIVSVLASLPLAKKVNIDQDRLIDVIMVGGVMSVVCARAYYVMFAPFKYDSLWDIINIRDGGIGIYGAVIGAYVFGALACKWRKVSVLDTADLAGTCFMLGQGIGRWGNFVNQEAFGTNTTNIFGMISESTTRYLASRQAALAAAGVYVDPSLPVHPTFLYESVWCIIGFVLLYIYFDRRKFKGEMTCLYVMWYGFGRFFIEGLRTDSLATRGGIRTSQVIAVVSFLMALAVIIYKYFIEKKRKEVEADV